MIDVVIGMSIITNSDIASTHLGCVLSSAAMQCLSISAHSYTIIYIRISAYTSSNSIDSCCTIVIIVAFCGIRRIDTIKTSLGIFS